MSPVMIDPALHDRVLECLLQNYGLTGSLRRLPGENLNFLLTTGRGRRFVAKIVGPDLPEDVVGMECAAVQYAIAAGFHVCLPETIKNISNTLETRIKVHTNHLYRMRLMTFVDGNSMNDRSDISMNLLKNVGETVAQFDQAMLGFDHPAAHRDHRWNLATAGQHEACVYRFGDPDREALLAWAFRGWHTARDRFGDVPWQVIHGDAHDENLLVEGDRVVGLVDFGDCCHNPAICDLAICLAYLMMRGPDPLPIAAAATGGYRRHRSLSAAELALLFPLACARLAVSLCVARERESIDPSNPNWFGGVQAMWQLLERLRCLGQDAFDDYLERHVK